MVFGFEQELPTYSFSLTENPWLTAAVIAFAVICIAGLFWRRYAGKISVFASAVLLACSTAYVISLIFEAYDWLGLYESLLDALESLPFVGPWLEVWVRESLEISAFPHIGTFFFYAGALLVLAGGMKTKGREVTLPRIEVSGADERDVPAAAVKVSDVGVDGLLGQSFLKRFVYTIDESREDKLILGPRPRR